MIMNGDPECVSLRFPSHTRYLGLVSGCAAEICRMMGSAGNAALVYDVQLSINEAVVNAIQHAYAGRSDGWVAVDFSLYADRLEISIIDWGQGFDWQELPVPDLSQPLEHGYGLYLVCRVMDEVIYHADPIQGNCLHLIKRLPGPLRKDGSDGNDSGGR